MKVSVIAAAFNEEDNVIPFCDGLFKAFRNLDYELLVVDDGSTDATYDNLRRMKSARLRIIRFKERKGKAFAWHTGFGEAAGDVIATIDVDLQNDPNDLLEMIKELDDGWDFVCGWRSERKDTLVKRLSSKLANRVHNIVFGLNLHDFNCPVKVFRRKCVSNVKYFENFHRFVVTMAHLQGFKIKERKVRDYPRTRGLSKYGLGRFVTSFKTMVMVKFGYRRLLN
jgi:dolichol-phosphate mannosyltransferase